MSASTSTKPETLRPDDQPLAHYRPIAPLAVVSVALGVASALILATPLLAPLPIAALVTGIAALRSIRRSQNEYAGQSVAIAGLCLATFFLGLGFTRHLARQSQLELRGREMADIFVGLLQDGKPQEAHQFRLSPSQRITSPAAIAEHYEKNAEAAKELQTFIGSTGIKELIALGRNCDLRFEGVASADRDGNSDMLTLKYSYQPPDAKADRLFLWVHINRRLDDSTKRHEWDIGGIDNSPPIGTE
jgi:hypothetical protein